MTSTLNTELERRRAGESPCGVDAGAEEPPVDADRALVERVRAGDHRAFAALYRRHAPLLARRLRAVLGREGDVEDTLQTTFLEVHRALGRYDAARPFGGWLHGIGMNVARRFLRARRRRWWLLMARPESLEATADSPRPSTEDEVAARQLAGRLYRAMERLAPGMRVAFALHEIDGLGLTEIASLQGTSPQAVGAQVERARRLVARRLRDFSEGSR